MAVTVQDYLTLANFKARARISSTDATDDTLLTALLTSASRWIDNHTGRREGAYQVDSNDAEYRYFPGSGGLGVWIDECTSISSCAYSDDLGTTYTTVTKGTDFWVSDGATYDKTPYRFLDIDPNSTAITSWPTWKRAIKVNARWGFSDTPDEPIQEACFALVQRMYHLKEGSGDEDRAIATEAGVWLPAGSIPSVVYALLSPYRRLR